MNKFVKHMTVCLSLVLFAVRCSGAPRAKNIILMISDGCGYNQVLAADYYQYGKAGEQVYEKFPVHYAVSTYAADGKGYNPQRAWRDFDYFKENPTHSAEAASAMSTGIKTFYSYMGIDSNKIRLTSMIEFSERLGKSTGVVTSVPFYHATPAGFVVHIDDRYNYPEIVRQMLEESPVDVIMGCGYPLYDHDGKSKTASDPKVSMLAELIQTIRGGQFGNDADGDGQNDPWTFIEEKQAFKDLGEGETPKRVLGVAQVQETLQEKRSGDDKADAYVVPFVENVPALADIAKGALNVLDNDQDGFFLMIEGGAIDWCGHDNEKGRLIEEQIDFNRAVNAVVSWVETNSSWDETLLIVTADHETGYLWGEGSGVIQNADSAGIDAVWKPLRNNGAGNMPGMEWYQTDHTNSLIPLYAKGAGSEAFQTYAIGHDKVRGLYVNNTDITKVMHQAFGIQP